MVHVKIVIAIFRVTRSTSPDWRHQPGEGGGGHAIQCWTVVLPVIYSFGAWGVPDTTAINSPNLYQLNTSAWHRQGGSLPPGEVMNPVPSIPRSRKSRKVDVVAHWWRCGASLVTEVLGSNPASPTMILMRCRIISHNVENVERETYCTPQAWGKKISNIFKNVFLYFLLQVNSRNLLYPLGVRQKKIENF